MAGIVEVRAFAVTCPPNTPQNAPQITVLPMPDREVLKIRVRIPPGPNGVMGWALGAVATSVIPTPEHPYIVASDEVFEWDATDFADLGDWQAIMYNTSIINSHTIYITMTVQVPDQPTSVPLTPASSVVQLSAPATTPTPVTASVLPPPPAVT